MERQIFGISTVPDLPMEESWRVEGVPYAHSVTQTPNQERPICSASLERDLLNQDLAMFWAQQIYEIENSTGFLAKDHLSPAMIKKVMKSDPQVKMVKSDTPILMAKACEMFIQEVTLRTWRQTQSCSRQTIRSSDVYETLKKSNPYDDLIKLVSFKRNLVSNQGLPPADVNVIDMKTPIDIDLIHEQTLYNLTAEDFIDIGEFELDPNIK